MKHYSIFLILVLTICGCEKQYHGTRGSQTPSLPSKGIKQTTLEEAMICKEYYKGKKDYDLTAKYLEHMIPLEKDYKEMGKLILELADLHLELGNREKARSRYGEYKLLYPGSKAIKYVLYKEIVAHVLDMSESTRDQTKTKEAIQLAEKFLQEFPDDTDFWNRLLGFLDN